MNGKVVGSFIVIAALIGGAALYYLQVYHWYEEVSLVDPVSGEAEVALVSLSTGAPEPILSDEFQGIDAQSSPLRFRGCFTTTMSHALLSETYEVAEGAVPLTAPGWFDCFDADAIAEGLQSGAALAFLGEKNVDYGVDRVVAIFNDGRGFVWHQLNNCGRKAYDGSVVGEECPPRTETETN